MATDHDGAIVEFQNGIQLYKSDVTESQIERYSALEECYHEPVEEFWFEKVFSELEQSLPQGASPIFVDIGAALGYYSLLFIRRFVGSKIYAVDPHPYFQERMEKTFELNGYSRKNYSLIPYAVYPHSDTVVFELRDFASHISQGASSKKVKGENTLIVPARRLSVILSEISDEIDLVKMDIQAAELAVFNNNVDFVNSGVVKYWVVGTHGGGIHKSILEQLSQCHEILYENNRPEGQADGLIVAKFPY